MKTLLKNILFALLLFTVLQAEAQVYEKNKKQHWGIELDINYDELYELLDETAINPNGNFPLPSLGISFDPSIGLSIGGVYQYNPVRWLGLQSGLGLRAIFAYRDLGLTRQGRYRNVLLARIPLSVQLRPIKWFAVEGGLNAHIYLLHNDGYQSDGEIRANDFEPLYLDWQAGMRFWLVENLSLGLAVSYNMSAMATSPAGYNLDIVTANVNLRYMWPF